MHDSSRSAQWTALAIGLLLSVGACSSGDDVALSCDEVAEPSAVLRAANGRVGQIVDAHTEASLGTDYDAVLGAIGALRPIQDVDGPLGTIRDGLDNMEADVIALQEGRYDDKVGDYGIAALDALVVGEICG